MKITLIGTEQSKRTEYFKKAADEMHQEISVVEWKREDFSFEEFKSGEVKVKLDPPSYNVYDLETMQCNLRKYQSDLRYLSQLNVDFLNSPTAIWEVLDKRGCKLRLQEGKVPSTRILLESVDTIEQLTTYMEERKVFSVFIKPVFFSGAAGVSALRLNPRTKQMLLYTSCKLVNGSLVNTKTLDCIRDTECIYALLNVLLKMDIMVEYWYPKSVFHGKSYDLRVVYQFGHIAHIVVRQSNGPVTNLHLNNQALEIKELGLDTKMMDQIEEVCQKGISLFPGLLVAGIDILIEKNQQKPYIIEINGQGDLIYQDIFGENRIYKEQIAYLSQI